MSDTKLYLYKVINPHDAWTMYAPSIEVAACAVGVLGPMYAAKCVNTGETTPILSAFEAWLDEHKITPTWFAENLSVIADTLESFICCTPDKRPVFDELLGRMDAESCQYWRANHLEDTPGNIKNLGLMAQEMAKFYRESLPEPGAPE